MHIYKHILNIIKMNNTFVKSFLFIILQNYSSIILLFVISLINLKIFKSFEIIKNYLFLLIYNFFDSALIFYIHAHLNLQ
jgi:hypothetical protein